MPLRLRNRSIDSDVGELQQHLDEMEHEVTELEELDEQIEVSESRITQAKRDLARFQAELAAMPRADVLVDEAVQAYQNKHPQVSYSDALRAVLRDDEELAAEFSAMFEMRAIRGAGPTPIATDRGVDDEAEERASVGLEIDRLMTRYQERNPKSTVSEALQAVLKGNPRLAERYRDSFGAGKGRRIPD